MFKKKKDIIYKVVAINDYLKISLLAAILRWMIIECRAQRNCKFRLEIQVIGGNTH
jgi:hypothetical protein